MPKFKHPDTGAVIEVDEIFAEQVLRPQGKYTEVKENEEYEATSDSAKDGDGIPRKPSKRSKKQSTNDGARRRPQKGDD